MCLSSSPVCILLVSQLEVLAAKGGARGIDSKRLWNGRSVAPKSRCCMLIGKYRNFHFSPDTSAPAECLVKNSSDQKVTIVPPCCYILSSQNCPSPILSHISCHTAETPPTAWLSQLQLLICAQVLWINWLIHLCYYVPSFPREKVPLGRYSLTAYRIGGRLI